MGQRGKDGGGGGVGVVVLNEVGREKMGWDDELIKMHSIQFTVSKTKKNNKFETS